VKEGSQWGTVCDDNFIDNQNAAKVFCRSMGYVGGTFVASGEVADGTLPILMDDVTCTGNEFPFWTCSYKGQNSQNCQHTEDIGVDCYGLQETRLAPATDSISSDWLSNNGFTSTDEVFNVGRLEIYVIGVTGYYWDDEGQWGTVCDDCFDGATCTGHSATGNAGPKVACRSMGYKTGTLIAAGNVVDSPQSFPTLLDNTACLGHELSLKDCTHEPFGSSNCSPAEDAGVKCDGLLRIVPTADHIAQGIWNVGRLEVYWEGEWGTVCDDNFGNKEASMACKAMGFADGVAQFNPTTEAGRSTQGIFMDEVNCSSTETHFWECSFHFATTTDCGHNEDVGVNCT